MREWYYLIGERHFGPIEEAELRHAFITKQLAPNIYVFREGLAEWMPAASCPELVQQESCPPPSPVEPTTPLQAKTSSPKQSTVFLWWPQSLIGNVLLAGLVSYCALIAVGRGDFTDLAERITAIGIASIVGRMTFVIWKNRRNGRLAFASSPSVAQFFSQLSIQLRLCVGVLIGSLAIWITFNAKAETLSAYKTDLIERASAVQSQMQNMSSQEYKENLAAEGFIRLGVGDIEGLENRVTEEQFKARAYMADAEQATGEIREVIQELRIVRTTQKYALGLAAAALILTPILTHASRTRTIVAPV